MFLRFTWFLILVISFTFQAFSLGTSEMRVWDVFSPTGLESPSLKALSLASIDFNMDGFPDLLTGFESADGGVLIILDGETKIERYRPFETFKSVGDFPLIAMPHFLAAGDFNMDGFPDVAFASKGASALYLMFNDGKGGLFEAETIQLPGQVTSLLCTDINRPDALPELVIGAWGSGDPKLLVFKTPMSASSKAALSVNLNSPVTGLVSGLLDSDYFYDLAAASGTELVVVRGQKGEGRALVDRLQFLENISSLTSGEFDGQSGDDLAILFEDGSLKLATGRELSDFDNLKTTGLDLATLIRLKDSERSVLISANHLGRPTSDIIVASMNLFQVISANKLEANKERTWIIESQFARSATGPIGLLPLRLNGDALADLILLNPISDQPLAFLESRAGETFVVNSTDDVDDGVCDNIHCSLREAIIAANSNVGLNRLSFSGLVSGDQVIIPTSSLPSIDVPISIDGTTHPDGKVVLNGSLAGEDADGFLIRAGNSVIRGMVIQAFNREGIEIIEGSNNLLEGNLIGTDVTGAQAIANQTGLLIRSDSNLVGGTAPGAGNLISGNGFGLLVSGFSQDIKIKNRALGNKVGVNLDGNNAIPNTSEGIALGPYVADTVIGGVEPGSRNLISGNILSGVSSYSTVGSLILGNYIGTDIMGAFAIPNGFGVDLLSYTQLGNGSPTGRNLVSGNNLAGIFGESLIIIGNYIGVDVSGLEALGNQSYGVAVRWLSSGGESIIQDNIISGNGDDGVSTYNANAIQIKGNIIGLDVNGEKPLGNEGAGVNIESSGPVTVGGLNPGEGNIISGNLSDGIFSIESGLLVIGNRIGTDATGQVGIGNGRRGVACYTWCGIGSSDEGGRNIISANHEDGVLVYSDEGYSVSVKNNYIGSDITGMNELGNLGAGVFVSGDGSFAIGGVEPVDGNLIIGNALGIKIGPVFAFNEELGIIAGNQIGENLIGEPIGNYGPGIWVGGFKNDIGPGNIVANNNGPGILVDYSHQTAPCNLNRISRNILHHNQGMPIDLVGDGHTANDPDDADDGPNFLQNYPELFVVAQGSASVEITGQIQSTKYATFVIEFFAGNECHESGYGSSEIFLGEAVVATDDTGIGAFTITFSMPDLPDPLFSATATDVFGNTSEFGNCKGLCISEQLFLLNIASWPVVHIADLAAMVDDQCPGF